MKKISIINIIVYIMTLLFVPLLIVIFTTVTIDAATTYNVPGDYLTIQETIDAANPGDTIQVAPMIYKENIVISKNLKLIGLGLDNERPIIDAEKSGHVVLINADNCELRRFIIQNSGNYRRGIYLTQISYSGLNSETIEKTNLNKIR